MKSNVVFIFRTAWTRRLTHRHRHTHIRKYCDIRAGSESWSILIGSSVGVARRNKNHLFLSALKVSIAGSGYLFIKLLNWLHAQTHNAALKLICAEAALIYQLLVCSWNSSLPWACARKKGRQSKHSDWEDLCECWRLHPAYLLCFFFVKVSKSSSSRWHTGRAAFLVCVENAMQPDSAGYIPGPSRPALRKSWIYMLWFV